MTDTTGMPEQRRRDFFLMAAASMAGAAIFGGLNPALAADLAKETARS